MAQQRRVRSSRLFLAALLLLAAPLAGCVDQTPDDDGSAGNEDPDSGTGSEDGSDDVSRAEPSSPSPEGTPISSQELQGFVDAFDDEPMVGGQETPKHVFKWVSEDAFIFLHLDDPDVTQATTIHYVGVAVKGVFCQESQPSEAFTHFHKRSAESWGAGHGGTAGDEGFWFTHIAVTPHEEPWGEVETGTDYDFMPTPAPTCGADILEPTFDDPDAGPIAKEEFDELVALFDDTPFMGGQDTPKHVFKWVSEDVFIFLHLDDPDVSQATTIHYFGPAVRGESCAEAQPHEDFTHFHKWTSESWQGGHGGGAGAYGYWFLHNAVTPHEEPWGQVEPGPDRDFMPTPPPSC